MIIVVVVNISNFWMIIAKVCFFVLFHEQTCTRFTRLVVRSFGCHHARNTLKTLIMLYFWKAKGSRTSKMIFWTVKYTYTHKHKYTNTQIYKYSIWQSARYIQYMLYFWKAKSPRTSKIIFWTLKYTNTQTQIHKYTNTQIHKYTNTAFYKVPDIPNICYIFEKPRVQQRQKWYSGLSNTQIQI